MKEKGRGGGKDTAASSRIVRRTWRDTGIREEPDRVIAEQAVALVYNGISHVVMMLTPCDLNDFAVGFSVTEGIVDTPSQVLDVTRQVSARGIELNITITARQFHALKGRRRNLTGRTGCGLCGAESLEQAIRQPRSVSHRPALADVAIDTAVRHLRELQPLQADTGAAHAAAWCDTGGNILLVREDVGRHNALDKLLGALLVQGFDRQGFILVTSRASYELVAKAASVDIGTLVAVSAATTLAIELALQSGISLYGFAQPGRHVCYTNADC